MSLEEWLAERKAQPGPVEISTLEQAINMLDQWIAHAKELERYLNYAEDDRDWWREQSDFWHGQLVSIVDMWIKDSDPKPKRRRSSPFDELVS